MQQTSEKITFGECACKTKSKHSKMVKLWSYSFAIIVAAALLCTTVAIWCLSADVAVLRTRVTILQMVVNDDLKTLSNLIKILRSHLQTNLKEKINAQNDLEFDEKNYPFSAHNVLLALRNFDEKFDYDDGSNTEEDTKEYDDAKNKNDDDNYYEDENEDIWFDKNGRSKTTKKKREISEKDTSEEKKGKIKSDVAKISGTERFLETSTQKLSTDVTSSEKINGYTSKEKFIPATHLFQKKDETRRKQGKLGLRYGSAEKFFTETRSTSSAPIQVRRSRTKSTETHEIEKKPLLHHQMFQELSAPLRDTITKNEAVRKKYDKYVEEPENNSQNYLENSNEQLQDALSYNMITIHFSADTSHYSRERHPHYFGNGRMQIKSDVYKDWKPAHWTQGMGMSKYFHLNQGRVTVSSKGIYLIYAQIQYSNVQEVNGFSVFRNDDIVVQCITTSTHPNKQEIKSNTCGISTTILLQSNDSICIKDLHHGRYVVLTPEKSYFGLVLLSPFKK